MSMGATNLERQIRSQPDALQDVLRSPTTRDQVREAAEGLQRSRRIWLVGTGTSFHAAELGAAMFREAGRSAQAFSSMHFVDWAPVLGPQDGIIVIPHTGEKAYALSARAQASLAGLHVVTIARKGLHIPHMIETVEKETAETYTVSYTAALAVLGLIAGEIGATEFTPDKVELAITSTRNSLDLSGIDEVPIPERLLVITGAGPSSVSAREGALKVREGARVLAEGYDAEYLLHGSAVPLTPQDHLLAIVTPDGDGFVDALGTAAEKEGLGVTRLAEPSPLPLLLAQIPLTVRLQLLALRFATARGQNPDVVITGAWAEPSLWDIGLPRA
jgi:glutamine---fructose-6-phosphate transaminase (isomerizing)